MGQEEEAAERRKIFMPYQLNSDLMSHARKDAYVMHCLPAHRGDEITNEAADGPDSSPSYSKKLKTACMYRKQLP